MVESFLRTLVSMSFWCRSGNGRSFSSGWNVEIAIVVTAMAGIAVAVTLVYSRRGDLKSPWSRGKRKHALPASLWKDTFLEDGKLKDGGAQFLKRVRSGGVDPSIRAEVWPFLLGVYELNSSKSDRDSVTKVKREEYEDLRKQCLRLLNREEKSCKIISEENSDSLEQSQLITKDSPSYTEDPEVSSCIEDEVTNAQCDTALADNTSDLKNTFSDKKSEDIDISHGSTSKDCLDVMDNCSDEKSKNIETKVREENQSSWQNADCSSSSSDICNDGQKEIPEVNSSVIEEKSVIAQCNSSEKSLDSSREERIEHSNDKLKPKSRYTEDFATWQRIIRLDAIRANDDWVNFSPTQAFVSDEVARNLAEDVGLKDYDHLEPCRIFHAARLVAILEAYAFSDPEIGYCQGMSDLLSPIITVIEDDWLAFWCFVGFMQKAKHNFRLDEVGIRRQLDTVSKIIKYSDLRLYKHLEKLEAQDCFFVYRMVVVMFRRELTLEQTMCLWEVMWADQAAIRVGFGKSAWGRIRQKVPPTDDLLLYAISACILQRKKKIVDEYRGVDEIMKECNSMAGQLDVWKLLDDAHDLVVTLHDKI